MTFPLIIGNQISEYIFQQMKVNVDYYDILTGVACRNLNYEAGLVLCCSPYGTADDPPIMTKVKCTGNENKFTDCPHSNVSASEAAACTVNNAAVACYNGEKPTG